MQLKSKRISGTTTSSSLPQYFGIGSRRCPGEVLGRAAQFLFFAGLIQNFKYKGNTSFCFVKFETFMPSRMMPEPGAGMPDGGCYRPGLNQRPPFFNAVFRPRF